MTSSAPTMDIGSWLRGLGLGQYEALFRENEIDADVLSDLTELDLEKLGLPPGHRKRLLKAIANVTARVDLAGASSSAQPRTLQPAAESVAERRQVTVMFSDLVGSTALSTRMDPEDFREIISAYQKCVADTVQRFGGFVAKYMGDGVLVYFGYPRAHEDDAERAVRAGLELIQAVGRLQSGAPLKTRVGIATGLVVVGDLIGSGASLEQAVVGETPNLAARLQAIASPNSIVIGPTTRRVLADLFDYQDLGLIDLKGFDAPVRAHQVLRASTVESRFQALRTATTPLIGRDEEVDLLMRRWDRAKQGNGSVVLVCGEPGIGKSRLTQAVQDRLGDEPHIRLRYFCSPHHQDAALFPVITQLERAAGFRRDDTDEQRIRKLEAVLAPATKDLDEAVSLVAYLLSIPTGELYAPLNLTPQNAKKRPCRLYWLRWRDWRYVNQC